MKWTTQHDLQNIFHHSTGTIACYLTLANHHIEFLLNMKKKDCVRGKNFILEIRMQKAVRHTHVVNIMLRLKSIFIDRNLIKCRFFASSRMQEKKIYSKMMSHVSFKIKIKIINPWFKTPLRYTHWLQSEWIAKKSEKKT